jgi:outer membrane receptor protein involved in Fe transport
LRLLAEREAGQLDFNGFASSASLINNNVSAGNRNLLPARTTRLELSWEHRFWQRASITLSARREFIAGLLDHIPVTVNGRTFDTIGNAGAGRRDRLQASLILPLDNLGLTGVTLNAAGTLSDTRLRDPVTGILRPFSGEEPQEGALGFTQDLPRWKLRWGGEYDLAASEVDYRIDEVDSRHHPSRLRLFAEFRPSPAWTVRLFGEELAQSPFRRERLIYDGLRGSAKPDYRELRRLNNGALLGVNLQYDFGL